MAQFIGSSFCVPTHGHPDYPGIPTPVFSEFSPIDSPVNDGTTPITTQFSPASVKQDFEGSTVPKRRKSVKRALKKASRKLLKIKKLAKPSVSSPSSASSVTPLINSPTSADITNHVIVNDSLSSASFTGHLADPLTSDPDDGPLPLNFLLQQRGSGFSSSEPPSNSLPTLITEEPVTTIAFPSPAVSYMWMMRMIVMWAKRGWCFKTNSWSANSKNSSSLKPPFLALGCPSVPGFPGILGFGSAFRIFAPKLVAVRRSAVENSLLGSPHAQSKSHCAISHHRIGPNGAPSASLFLLPPAVNRSLSNFSKVPPIWSFASRKVENQINGSKWLLGSTNQDTPAPTSPQRDSELAVRTLIYEFFSAVAPSLLSVESTSSPQIDEIIEEISTEPNEASLFTEPEAKLETAVFKNAAIINLVKDGFATESPKENESLEYTDEHSSSENNVSTPTKRYISGNCLDAGSNILSSSAPVTALPTSALVERLPETSSGTIGSRWTPISFADLFQDCSVSSTSVSAPKLAVATPATERHRFEVQQTPATSCTSIWKPITLAELFKEGSVCSKDEAPQAITLEELEKSLLRECLDLITDLQETASPLASFQEELEQLKAMILFDVAHITDVEYDTQISNLVLQFRLVFGYLSDYFSEQISEYSGICASFREATQILQESSLLGDILSASFQKLKGRLYELPISKGLGEVTAELESMGGEITRSLSIQRKTDSQVFRAKNLNSEMDSLVESIVLKIKNSRYLRAEVLEIYDNFSRQHWTGELDDPEDLAFFLGKLDSDKSFEDHENIDVVAETMLDDLSKLNDDLNRISGLNSGLHLGFLDLSAAVENRKKICRAALEG